MRPERLRIRGVTTRCSGSLRQPDKQLFIILSHLAVVEANVAQRGTGPGVAKHAHEHRQTDAVADHIGGEGVAQAVRVRLRQVQFLAVVPEQPPGACVAHRFAAAGPLHHQEQLSPCAAGAFFEHVAMQQPADPGRQWDEAWLAALSEDLKSVTLEVDIADAQGEDFADAQPAGPHQPDHGLVAQRAQVQPERADLLEVLRPALGS